MLKGGGFLKNSSFFFLKVSEKYSMIRLDRSSFENLTGIYTFMAVGGFPKFM